MICSKYTSYRQHFLCRTPRRNRRQATDALLATPTPQRTPRRRGATEAAAPETSGVSPPKMSRLDELKENNDSEAALIKGKAAMGSPSVQLAKLCLNSPDPRQPLRKDKLA
jgi:hypothetical protein